MFDRKIVPRSNPIKPRYHSLFLVAFFEVGSAAGQLVSSLTGPENNIRKSESVVPTTCAKRTGYRETLEILVFFNTFCGDISIVLPELED